MEPGKPHYFSIEFTPRMSMIILESLLEQMKEQDVETFELECYGYTIDKQKKSVRFANKFDQWEFTAEDKKQFANLFAVLYEHGNDTIYFGLVYMKKYKGPIEIKIENGMFNQE